MRPKRKGSPAPDKIRFLDLHPPKADFRADVLSGLAARPRRLSPKYLYDVEGSRLFDEICTTPEYYITRTEIALLENIAGDLRQLIPSGAAVVEYGSGSSVKIRTLLNALEVPRAYMALDISRDHLLSAAEALSPDFPDVDVFAVCADFTTDFDLPEDLLPPGFRLGFLPGSTIGNFPWDEQIAILKRFRRHLGAGNGLLIGADLVKEPRVLEAAYDDAAGVTARFSLNLLARMDRELNAEITPDAFKHVARFDPDTAAIEIWLEAVKPAEIRIGGHGFTFAPGDRIETELSQKYTIDSFHALARAAGFAPQQHWIDDKELFSLHYLTIPES